MDGIKNERQIEFHALMDESGLSPAEIARRLEISEASISRYKKGIQTPSPSKIALLRRIVADIKEGTRNVSPNTDGVTGMRSADVNKAADALEEVHRADPEKFDALRQMIHVTHQSIKGVSSTVARAALGGASAAMEAARHEAPGSPPSPKADGSTSYKRGRAHDTVRKKKSRSATQGPAPK